MHQRNRKVERNDDGDFVEAAGQDIPGQDLLEMLGALRGPVDQQDRSCRRNDIDDPDQCFLRHACCPGPRERQQHSRQQSEGERVAVGREALRGMAEHEGNGCAERRDLRQREVDEYDIAAEYLDPEIRVDADKTHRHQKGRPQKSKRLGHLATAAPTSAATLVSNKARESPVLVSAPTEAASTVTDAPVLAATKARSRSGSCGSRTTMCTPRVRIV